MRKKEHRPPFTFCVVISSKKDKQNLKSICCILCRITRVTETFKFHFNNTVIVSAKYKFYHKFVGFVFYYTRIVAIMCWYFPLFIHIDCKPKTNTQNSRLYLNLVLF